MSFLFLFLFLFYIENNNKGNPEGEKHNTHFSKNHFPQEIYSPTWPKTAKAGQIGLHSLNFFIPLCYKTPKTGEKLGQK